MIDIFIKFINDRDAQDMYITGVAGTGKTTSLAKLIEYCIENRINTVTCAYTHKACSVLRSKLPAQNDIHTIRTLHSFLKKRPSINTDATKVEHVDGNVKAGLSDIVKIIFIDEFSQIGEKDYADILELQYDAEGELITKVVYIGDPNQLPPVKDMQTIEPKGDYIVRLDKIHRQSSENKLIDTLLTINDYINGDTAKPLEEHKTFVRGVDIIDKYTTTNVDKVILAFTNNRVQEINAQIQGRYTPEINDTLFSPTNRKVYTLNNIDDEAYGIIKINGDMLELNSKYKTLETVHQLDNIKFYEVTDEENNNYMVAGIFGHGTFLDYGQSLANEAVEYNRQISKKFNVDPKVWCQQNWSNELAKLRNTAWKKYMSFKECVYCLDFNHAMTVHKSQGSTYNTVFLDTQDIGKCADSNYKLYLKLMYVGISRASNIVYTN